MSDNVIEIRKPTDPAADVLGRFYQVYEEGFRAIRWLAHAIECRSHSIALRVLLPSSLGRASLFKFNGLLGHLSPLAGQIQIHQPVGRIGDNDRRSLAFHCFASAGFRTFVHAIETKGSVMEFLSQATTLERFKPRDPG